MVFGQPHAGGTTESCPLNIASSVAPKAPTPAASVGVAAPVKIEPSTAAIKNIGGIKLRIARDNLFLANGSQRSAWLKLWLGKQNHIDRVKHDQNQSGNNCTDKQIADRDNLRGKYAHI